jgi:hypothetical protein
MRTGIRSWHLKMVFHMTVVFAVAATCNVIPAVQDALHKKAYWIIVTIMAIGDITTGGIVDNGIQRIVGTLLGAVGVAAVAGFAYLANGSSYIGSSAAMKVTQGVIVTLWMTVLKLFASKYGPRYQKFFNISTLLPPLIALLDSSGIDVWANVGFRLVNTCLGVAIHTFFSFVLFPVTAQDHIVEKTSDCLLQMAQMLEDVVAPPPVVVEASSKGGRCFGLLKGKKNKEPSVPTGEQKEGEGGEEGEELKQPRQQQQQQKLEEDEAAAAASARAKAIIAAGIQKAGKSLLEIIKLRDVVARDYFVGKMYYTCITPTAKEEDEKKKDASASVAGSGELVSTKINDGIDLEYQQQQQKQRQQQNQAGKGPFCGIFIHNSPRRPPMQVYLLEQLISHLKHNIVYSNIALYVREWLLSQSTTFAKDPQVSFAYQSFIQQAAECFKALRLVILGMVTAEEALQTVLNLRQMATDISTMYNSNSSISNSSTNIEVSGHEATSVHVLLVTVHNIEKLFRAADRALVTRDKPGIVSITDQELGKFSQETTLSMLNLNALASSAEAVVKEEESAAVEDEKKRGVAVKSSVNEIPGMIQLGGV